MPLLVSFNYVRGHQVALLASQMMNSQSITYHFINNKCNNQRAMHAACIVKTTGLFIIIIIIIIINIPVLYSTASSTSSSSTELRVTRVTNANWVLWRRHLSRLLWTLVAEYVAAVSTMVLYKHTQTYKHRQIRTHTHRDTKYTGLFRLSPI